MGKRYKSVVQYFGIIRKRHNTMKNVPDVGKGRKRSPLMLYFKKGPHFTAESQLRKQWYISAIGRKCGPIVRELVPEASEYKPGQVTYNGVKARKAIKACAAYIREKLGPGIHSPEDVRAISDDELREVVKRAIGA